MIIQQSSIEMFASHEKHHSRTVTESTNQGGFAAILQEEGALQQALSGFRPFVVDARTIPNQQGGDNPLMIMTEEGYKFRVTDKSEEVSLQQQETRARIFQGLMEAISGKPVPIVNIGDITGSQDMQAFDPAAMGFDTAEAPKMEITVNMTETIEEYECTNYHACGVVKTADGAEIDFNLDLLMERSYSETRQYQETREVEFTDPLVINFNGNAAQLTETKMAFDLDADGTEEVMSFVTGDSGLLALDKNNDGVINDGTELFGALSGNGFADLAAYDDDNNGFIDEADSIFSDLKIWTRDGEGDQLHTLQDKGVGAIYLGSEETPFELKGEGNQTHGRVRASGFYLAESGEVGSVQQIDMAV